LSAGGGSALGGKNAKWKEQILNVKCQQKTPKAERILIFAFCNFHFCFWSEARGSLYWLKLVERSDLISGKELQPLLAEANELIKIVAKSVITAKREGDDFAICTLQSSF